MRSRFTTGDDRFATNVMLPVMSNSRVEAAFAAHRTVPLSKSGQSRIVVVSDAEPAPAKPATAATPGVRALAARHGVDLGSVKGTGAGGRISKADVMRSVPANAAVAAQDAYPAHWTHRDSTATRAARPTVPASAGVAYPAHWKR